MARALPRERFEIKMSLRKRKDRKTHLDTIEDFAYGPSGGRTKQWLAGVVVAAVPIVYGIVCIQRGSTTLFGSRASLISQATLASGSPLLTLPRGISPLPLLLGSQRAPLAL